MKKKTPLPPLGLANLSTWQDDPANIRWAQTDPMFRQVVTVLINERVDAMSYRDGETENCRLGRIHGYERAIQVLMSLASGKHPQPGDIGAPTYENPEQANNTHD